MFSAFWAAESRALEALSGPLLRLHCTGNVQGERSELVTVDGGARTRTRKIRCRKDICAGNVPPPRVSHHV